MKIILLIAILVPLSLCLFAQTRDSTRTKSEARVRYNPNSQRNGYENFQNSANATGLGLSPGATINTIDHRYEGLRGTPYFLPEWNKGQIEMVSGQNYTDVPIKFDAFRQHLILLRSWVGGDSIIINADQVSSFQLRNSDGQAYRFKRFPAAKIGDEALKEGYFMVLYEGKSSLLKRVVKTFKQADYKNPYSNDIRYDEFKLTSSYYLLKPDQTLIKVKLSDKALIEALGDHKDELKAFARQENLTFRTENDAIQLVKKHDSL